MDFSNSHIEDEEIIEQSPTFIENPVRTEGVRLKKKNLGHKKIEEEEEKIEEGKTKPYMGAAKNLKNGEFLDFDNKAYEMLHRANTEWPCLSFDVMLPEYSSYNFLNRNYENMEKYPYTVYLVAGTQTQSYKNYIYLLKLDQLHKTKYDDDSEAASENEDSNPDIDADIYLSSIEIKNNVNRLKSMQFSPVIATWNENAEVSVYNIQEKFSQLQEKGKKKEKDPIKEKKKKKNYLVKNFKHTSEGFALNWSPLKKGLLVSGSVDRKIFLYQSADAEFSDIIRQDHPYIFHTDSVEDVQFSPVEDFAFASCNHN